MTTDQQDERDMLIRHDEAIGVIREEITEIKELLTNHVHELSQRLDNYKTLFISILVTLAFTLAATILNLLK